VAELLGSSKLALAEEGELAAHARSLTAEELDILRSAVKGFGREASLPIARAAREELSGFHARAGALELLAVVGLSADIELAIAVASPPDRSTGEAQRLLSQLERTLEQIARRDRGVNRELEPLLRNSSPEIASSLLRGFASVGDPAGLPALVTSLSRGGELALLVLSEIGRAARKAPRPLDGLLLDEVRRHLDDVDPLFVRAAARAVGELRDFDSTDALIDLLESPSPMLREESWLALQELSGLAYAEDPALWQAWHEREKQWFEAHSEELFRGLESPHAGRVIQALSALAGHRYRCDEVAANVAEVLAHSNPAVRRQACSTLASLGSGPPVEGLVQCLDDPDPGVARAAWHALRAAGGGDLPTDRPASKTGFSDS
jgi:HEAT repeat protein